MKKEIIINIAPKCEEVHDFNAIARNRHCGKGLEISNEAIQ